MPVDTVHEEYDLYSPMWERLRDCAGGRDSVLKAGQKYVPALPGATEEYAYRDYVNRGNFLNALARTVKGLAGAMTQKPPTLEVPPSMDEFMKDVTQAGQSALAFIDKVTEEVLQMWRYGVLVEMSDQPGVNLIPYLVPTKAEDIINWRTERFEGEEVLNRVILRQYKEVASDPKDEFKTECETTYLVCELIGETASRVYQQRTFRKVKDKDGEHWVATAPVFPERKGTKLNFIPFVVMPGIDVDRPPLVDLADVNLGHWRNSCDHEEGLHLIALPTPWRTGSKGIKEGEPMPLGPSNVWDLGENGSAGMLEFNGAGLQSILSAMDKKEKQMAALGARLLEEQGGPAETAYAVGMRHSGEQASVRSTANCISMGMTKVFQIVGWWLGGETKPEEVKVKCELNKDYLSTEIKPAELKDLIFSWQAGGMSYETLYYNMQRGGRTRPNVTWEEEKELIDAEAPELEPTPEMPPEQL